MSRWRASWAAYVQRFVSRWCTWHVGDIIRPCTSHVSIQGQITPQTWHVHNLETKRGTYTAKLAFQRATYTTLGQIVGRMEVRSEAGSGSDRLRRSLNLGTQRGRIRIGPTPKSLFLSQTTLSDRLWSHRKLSVIESGVTMTLSD